MLNLPRPHRDDAADLELAIATTVHATHRATLESIRAQVLAAYALYETAIAGIGSCAPLGLASIEREAMEFSYDALAYRLDLVTIRDELLGAEALGGYCPLCGVNQATTLDHFAAKSAWSEFACYSLNLVPACPTCNTKKDKLTASTLEAIPFVHPYLHKFPDHPILRAEVFVEADSVSVSFQIAEPAAGAGAISMAALEHQTGVLKILERIERAGNAELVAAAVPCKMIGDYGGPEEVAAYCDKQANAQASWGPNHWRAALYRALAGSDAFCAGAYELIPTE